MKKENLYYLSFSIFFAALIFLGTSLDPDMFWHINNGKTIIENGITSVNIQSYSQGYFISHSWLYDVSVFSIFNTFGYVGLKIISSIFIAGTIFIVFKLLDRHKPNLLLLFVIFSFYYITIIGFLEVRPQQISLFLTVFAVYIIETKKSNPIYMLFIGILFANLHGGAIIQLLTIVALYSISYIVNLISGTIIDYKTLKNIMLSLLAIIIGSFINPYGKEILLYPFKSLSQQVVKLNINEWFPLIDNSRNMLSIISLFLLILAIAALAYNKKATIKEIIFISFSIMSSLIYRRMYLLAIILIFIFGYPHIELMIRSIFNKIKIKNSFISNIFKIKSFAITILILSIVFFVISAQNVNFQRNIKASILCPELVLQYIQKNNIDVEKNVMFNHFNFGGYLQFKGYKTFVDGRADAFLSSYEKNEPIFEDYISILDERIPDKTIVWFNKYNIKYIIIYSKNFIKQNGKKDSMQEYLEYSKIAKTLFDDGKYAFMEVKK